MVQILALPAPKNAETTSSYGVPKSREEKIFVTVRVRPLNKTEEAQKDQVAWDFTNENTIFLKSITGQSSGTYTFDRVFDPSCAIQEVYDAGAKYAVLSSLFGINATILAYGQESSGKTFTMKGITEKAVGDIYDHIANTADRDFLVKFSALEIYNEIVIDLLNRDSGPLRLLDDPEKGTTVENQIEEVAKDCQHLRSLIELCEAQRKVGGTGLKDTNSRSHLIMKLTVLSTIREYRGPLESYIGHLYLVDLAGRDRASQTNVDGMRLKEYSHVNHSLLTLGTVIRKLSIGKGIDRFHIPYRDSKLTRILQPSLGGNTRTVIMCTMSPALSHVAASRSTLSFAICAKEITNSLKVNMVVVNTPKAAVSKRTLNHEDREARCCNRLGCGTSKLNHEDREARCCNRLGCSTSSQLTRGSSSKLDSLSDSKKHHEELKSPPYVPIDRDSSPLFNIDGIAEVFSAMQRAEQNVEMEDEEKKILESILFLEGLSIIQQHMQDTSLENANMAPPYEELLDLVEIMGIVSTGLSEEALSNCVERSLYGSDAKGKSLADDFDVKCTICQEEYINGDVMGKLRCGHSYHMACIHQWLLLKDSCPICKAPAALS